MKIVVTAGGTMGHINPALAIIDTFKKNEKELEVLYIGTTDRMESKIIPEKNIPYYGIPIYGFTKDIPKDIKNIYYLYKDIKECKKLLKSFQPDVVIGVGGYVTYPVLKAAHELHIKTFIHEQNSVPGKTNRIIAKYASLIGISFESSRSYFKTKGSIIYTGHPCGKIALEVPPKKRSEYVSFQDQKLLTIVAGSLGSASLNEAMKSFLLANHPYNIVYITGQSHYKSFCKDTVFPPNVKVVPFINELPGLLKISDGVISRAGAGSLSELCALEIPSLIIPSPNVAYNHQYLNALELKNKECILLLEEKDLSSEVLNSFIDRILNNEILRESLKKHMQQYNTLNSGLIIYQKIKEMLS